MSIFVGWLYASKKELEELREMGVYGLMDWKPDKGIVTKALGKNGIVESCLCSEETHTKLQERYEELWMTKYPYYNSPGADKVYPDFSEITEERAEEYFAEWEEE